MSERAPAAWLALLSPLPAGVRPRRSPVSAPGTPGAAPDSPIAGWESLVMDLSDPPFGGRVIQVTLDAAGRPLSASDHVLRRFGVSAGQLLERASHIRQESVGGRIEADDSFRGTHWIVEGPEPEDTDDDVPPQWTRTPRPPTREEHEGLMRLVREMIERDSMTPGPVNPTGEHR